MKSRTWGGGYWKPKPLLSFCHDHKNKMFNHKQGVSWTHGFLCLSCNKTKNSQAEMVQIFFSLSLSPLREDRQTMAFKTLHLQTTHSLRLMLLLLLCQAFFVCTAKRIACFFIKQDSFPVAVSLNLKTYPFPRRERSTVYCFPLVKWQRQLFTKGCYGVFRQRLAEKAKQTKTKHIFPLPLGLKSKYMALRLNSGYSYFFNSFQRQLTRQKISINLE